VVCSCECGDEPLGSIKCGEFIDWLRTCYLLKKDSAPWSKYVMKSDYSLWKEHNAVLKYICLNRFVTRVYSGTFF